MMSQRFSLFYAGFTSYAPALYFYQLNFIENCDTSDQEELKSCLIELSKSLEDKADENNSYLKTAMSIAGQFDLDLLPHPVTHADYSDWLHHYVSAVEREFPMSRIDHYYFLYARKIAEILRNTGLIIFYVDITLKCKQQIDLSRKIEKCLKDTEYILFKLMASAALLSSEPRQNYFNMYYRSLCQEFETFKDTDTFNPDLHYLKKLSDGVKDYDLLLMDGFKKCIGMLKELGI